MIRVGKLRKLLRKIPDKAEVHIHKFGEEGGLSIVTEDKCWYIRADSLEYEDTYIEGFEEGANGS